MRTVVGLLSDRERDSESRSDDRVESFMRVMDELGIENIQDIPNECLISIESKEVWVIK